MQKADLNPHVTRFARALEERLGDSRGGATADELDQLRRDAEAVEDLVAAPGWAVLTRLVEAEDRRIDLEVMRGAVLPQANYAAALGIREGLQKALAVPEAVSVVYEKYEQLAAERSAREE